MVFPKMSFTEALHLQDTIKPTMIPLVSVWNTADHKNAKLYCIGQLPHEAAKICLATANSPHEQRPVFLLTVDDANNR